MHTLRDDLYLVVGSINPDTKVATLQIHLNPFVGWIWLGGIILVLACFLCMFPEFEAEESKAWRAVRGVGAITTSITLGIILALLPVPAFAQSGETQHAGSVQIDSPQEKEVFGKLRCMCGTCPRELLDSCACSTAQGTRERLRLKLARGEAPEKIIHDYTEEYGTGSLAIRRTKVPCAPSTHFPSSSPWAWAPISPSRSGVGARPRSGP